MKTIKISIILLISILLISCGVDKEKNELTEGVWESIGYGKILKIYSDKYAYYDITKSSCVAASQGAVADFGHAITVQNDTLSISSGTSIYKYFRINSLPNLCSKKNTENNKTDPVYNFEVFSKTIEENYAYFELNQINWGSLYIDSKNKITSKTTDVELYLVLDEMIDILNDNHGDIEPTDEVYEKVEQLNPQINENIQLKEYGDFQIAQMVTDHFLDVNLTKDSWLLQWGTMKNNIGYIQVKAMWLFGNLNLSDSLVKQNGFVDTYVEAFIKLNESNYIKAEVEGVSLIMDKVMKDLNDTDFLILDVRFNGGGQDAVGLEILRNFNDKKIQVATKSAKYKNDYTKKTPIFMESSKDPYKKNIYLLTSQQSASATDFMALASLELENVKRIGSPTNGALSDALEKKLPNGWYFSISNLLYEDNQGRCYENTGIPVNYELNYSSDRQTFFRSVANDLEKDKISILAAIEKLRDEQ